MQGIRLPTLDLGIILLYLFLALGAGVLFSRRAGLSVDQFLVGGRRLPWWLAGTSMIASAFAIDTPLGITGLVAEYGIQGVWFAWSFMLGGAGVAGAFVFAALLRRSRIITTAELIELRYSGKPAAWLRLFKGIYFGVLQNCIIMAWVLKAVSTFGQAVLGWENPFWALVLVLAITLLYTSMAGLWGIAVTDLLQYVISTVGTIALAVIALQHVGGIDGLLAGLAERYGPSEVNVRLQFIPRPDSSFFHVFLVFVLLKWWGNPPGAITQRIVSSKDERHASWATMFFSLVHFALNYWPMIMAALVSLVIYTNLPPAEAELGYARLIVDMLPSGLLGIMLASLTAAFMSTIDTHIHLGATYMVNDIYRRFLVRQASEAHYIRVSRAATVVMLIMTLILAQALESVRWAWEFLATMTAGYGTVVVLRWFWWRINAWGEISALLASFVLSQTCELLRALGWSFMQGFGNRFLVVFFGTTLIWIFVTCLTPPTDPDTLQRFCRKVRPHPVLWGPIRESYPDLEWDERFGRVCLHWLLGVLGLIGVCFGTGHIIFGQVRVGAVLWGVAAISAAVIAMTYRPDKNSETWLNSDSDKEGPHF
jgi:SSS family solute:Na+ symporter